MERFFIRPDLPDLRLSRRQALDVMKEQSGNAFDPVLLTRFLEMVTTVEVDELQAEIIDQRLSWQAV